MNGPQGKLIHKFENKKNSSFFFSSFLSMHHAKSQSLQTFQFPECHSVGRNLISKFSRKVIIFFSHLNKDVSPKNKFLVSISDSCFILFHFFCTDRQVGANHFFFLFPIRNLQLIDSRTKVSY